MADNTTELKVRTDPAPAQPQEVARTPFDALRHEIDRLFDDFLPASWGQSMHRPLSQGIFAPHMTQWAAAPAMDIVEKNGVFLLTVELPGVDPGEIDVKISDGMITISGEKKEEVEKEEGDMRLSERRYGQFQRSCSLPDSIDIEKVGAQFSKGVLTVTLPKSAKALASEKKIEVRAA